MKNLHRDWPEFDVKIDPYQWPDPVYDLAYALDIDHPDDFDMRRAIKSIETIESYSIRYEGKEWLPGRLGGTELDLVLIAKLYKNSYLASGNKLWMTVEAWNDMSGWGGQHRVSVELAETLSDARDKLSFAGQKRLNVI